MAHKRKTLRDYVVALLKAAPVTDADQNVFNCLIYPTLKDADFPVLNVFIQSEQSEQLGVSPVYYRVNGVLVVEAIVQQPENTFDALDGLCDQIRSKIDLKLGNNVEFCLYAGTDIRIDADANKAIASAEMRFNYRYTIEENYLIDPDDMDNLDAFSIKYDMKDLVFEGGDNPDGQIDAEDLIEGLHS